LALSVEYISTEQLIPYVNNSRTHDATQVKQVAASIQEFGFTNPVLIDEQRSVIAGHGRIQAAELLKMDEVPTITLAGLSEAQKKAYVIADNQLALNAGWDVDLLKVEIESLKELEFDVELLGFEDDFLAGLFDDDDGELYADGVKGQMSSDFGFSPFTVFNAREGGWQKRKQYWIEKGIKSESGRDENLISYSKISKRGEKDTSIFDPVLCEIGYEWFSPKGGLILDPFAGGSVRGIVAAECGREYIGNDLSENQVEANRIQAENICKDIMPAWTIGDSRSIKALVGDIEADAIFSCPPYADLEVYSDDPADISNMSYSDFMDSYRAIISECYDLLKDNSFAVWTIGEVRDKKGNYLNFVGDTISAFKDAGFNYYNEAILVTMVGSLPLRTGKTMKASRKLGKTHQNVLVFVKGEGKLAAQRCGDIEINISEENTYGESL
tara:strand:- start:91 stop:1413 length:1323 start_codon:yes stop_codon:yes gene_type:complete